MEIEQGKALLTLAIFSLFFNPAISRQSVTRHDEFPQVTGVQITSPHCGRPDGQLIISAYSPSGSGIEYSIDNGVTYFPDSIFSGLPAGMYIVRILDADGNPGFYEDNPVMLTDIPGPQVLQVHITNETDFLGNGSIQVIATVGTPNVFFSIDSGISWQTNNGTFNNLHSGIYNVLVKDENECDTTFTIEIQNIIITYLQVITGEGGFCVGETAIVPVNVDNFNSVAGLHLKLSYNADYLTCEGFADVHPQLANISGWIDQAAGDINLEWNSSSPVTFTGPEKIADLVFTTKSPGQGGLTWYTGEAESYFTDVYGNPIPTEYTNEEAFIYDPPDILLDESRTVCIGQSVSIISTAIGNAPPFSYLWTYPDGSLHAEDPFFASVTLADSGNYTLLVTDILGCTDQKTCHLEVTCLAIDENISDRLVIYPNPGNGIISIRLPLFDDVKAEVLVTDLAGSLVYQRPGDFIQSGGSYCINLSNFQDGIYFLKLITKKAIFQEKLIIRHD